MKSLLVILALALIALAPSAFADDKVARTISDISPTKVVMFYSDSCAACKILEPRFNNAMTALNHNAIELITFDFSSKGTIESTKALANEKGVNPILQTYGAKTGFAVILDNNDNEITKFTIDSEASDIAQEMAKIIIANNTQ